MRKLHPLLSRLLALTLLIGLLGVTYLLAIDPLHKRAADLEETIALSETLLQRLSQQPGDPKILRQKLDTLAAVEKPKETGLLRGDNAPIAGAFVQSFLTASIEGRGGTVRSIQVLPVTTERGLRRIAARAQLRITSVGLRDLLHRIEGNQPHLFVDNLDIRRGQATAAKADETEDVSLLVRFDVYGFLAAAPVAEERS